MVEKSDTEKTLRERMEAISPGSEEKPAPTVGVWIRKAELEAVVKGDASVGHGAAVMAMVGAIDQPVFVQGEKRLERKKDAEGKEVSLKGPEGAKELLDGFGNGDLRRLHFDKDKVVEMAADGKFAGHAMSAFEETASREDVRQKAQVASRMERKAAKDGAKKEGAGVEA